MHQLLLRTQQGPGAEASQEARVTPGLAVPSPMGHSPTGSEHGRQRRVLLTGSTDSPGQDGMMRLHPGALKDKAGDKAVALGPKSTQERGAQDRTGTSVYMRGLSRRQATYSLSQSRRQGQRHGCRQVHLQQRLRAQA